MNSYDKYKEGLHDDDSPVNKSDSEEINSISEAMEDNDPISLIEMLSEVRKEVNFLRDYAKANENQYLLKLLNSIYNKL